MLSGITKAQKVNKDDYKARVADLRVGLINAQYDLKSADFPVVILIAGDDRVGASEVVNRLNQWMDSRFLQTIVLGERSEEEAERPRFWRLWRSIPRKGRAALWVGGLMREVANYLAGEVNADELTHWATNLRQFQDELIADGALVLKFYLHTPAKVQKKRIKKSKKTDGAWRYDERDWQVVQSMAEGLPVVEAVLRQTTTAGAPWQVVEGSNKRTRDLTIAESIRTSIEHRLETGAGTAASSPAAVFSKAPDLLGDLDLDQSISKEDYEVELERLQGRVHKLADKARRLGISTVLAFEGSDAGGKGGAIRRVTAALEAGDYQVVPVAAPTTQESQYNYLWRFWRDLPRDGQFTIFDRTWYGRVLVERIEGFCDDAAWQRAYSEIADFEDQITSHGSYLGKFWLAISPEEQLARFKAREVTPYKKHKITDEDYRNREKWDEYSLSVNEMVERTSTPAAPWTLVPGNDKYTARLTVLRTVADGLKRAIKNH